MQNRKVARVGSSDYKDIDIRLVCATNMDLEELVKQNKFRQDLLYRINTVEINLPPLRDRIEDISLLTHHFFNTYKMKYKKADLIILDETLEKLSNYRWPGNVRELQHAIERAVILSETDQLSPADFFQREKSSSADESVLDNFNLEFMERTIINKVLSKNKGNITNAAKELGLTRTSLYRRIEKYGL